MGYAKGTKITDPNVLARLKKAREKALETRRANAQKRKEAKELAKYEKREEQNKIKKRLDELKNKKSEVVTMQIEEKKAPPPVESKHAPVEAKPAPVSPPSPKPTVKTPPPSKRKNKRKKVRYIEDELYAKCYGNRRF